ncbi:MAG: ABC transporter substrate-binding protein [Frankia sp.]|nr:ABC transporter substrate-binding protein [Frankia sp.]
MLAGLLAALLTAALAACGGSSDGGAVGEAAISPTATATPREVPTDKPGGTLRIVAESMPTGDPGWADTTGDRVIARLLTRQLYSYPADRDVAGAVIPRPDLAVGAPTVTENGTVYTVRLRSAAKWDTTPPRRITASDVARGIKRLCLPPNPSPMRGYFSATVVGFNDYCTQLFTMPVEQAQQFIESESPEGIQVINDIDIAFKLIAPVNDFVDILALPAASPVPFEALRQPPDSPQFLANLVSDGPYRITSVADGVYRLSRNPGSNGSIDPLRRALPDHVEIRTGIDAATAQQMIEAGEADMALDAAVPADRARELALAADPRLRVAEQTGSTLLLAVGFNGPSAAALRELSVREALTYCVDRAAVATALGSPLLARPTTQLLQPTMTGYTELDPFPTTPADAGDPARCAAGLAETPGGPVTALTLLTTDSPRDAAVADALVAAFGRAGVRLDVRALSPVDFAAAAVSPVAQTWDLALTTITPLWFGDAGRTVFQPLLDDLWVGARPVDGGYRSTEVPGLLAAALRASDETVAAANWAELERTVLTDVAVIPLAVVTEAHYHSQTVLSWIDIPSLGTGDPTGMALGPA